MKRITLPAALLLIVVLTVPHFLIDTAALEPVHKASDEYKVSRYYAYLKSLTLTGDQRTDVILVALSQLGYHEGDSEADMGGGNTRGSRDFVEYNRLFGKVDNNQGNGVSYGYYWCVSFATWCIRQAGVPTSVVKTEVSNIRLIDWLKANSAYKTKESGYIPKTADLIFFRYVDSKNPVDHVGLVRYVSGSTVYTIEGNTKDDSVGLREYKLTDERIIGFGTPAYTSKPSAAIDFSMQGECPTGTYMINTASLNIRSGPSINYSIVGAVPQNEWVTVTATDKNWGKINYGGKEGWISLSYAIYLPQSRYVITYNLSGGTGTVPAQPKADGVSTTLSNIIPTRQGYTFAGWATKAGAKTAEYAAGATFSLNADTTLYAVWSSGNVNVKFYSDETLLLSADYPEGGEATQPPTPIKPADNVYKYTFAGWDTDNDGKVDVRAGEKIIAKAGLVCRAVYEKTYVEYTIKFYGRDGLTLIDEGTYHYGDTVIIPTPENYREGRFAYTFTGWNTPVEATVSKDASYFAIFEESIAKYSVSFIDGNGNLMESSEYEYGQMVTLPSETPQKDPDETYTYVFREWDNPPGSVIADTVYRALFDSVYIEYKITFEDGYGQIISELTAHYGDVIAAPDVIPEKASDKMYKYEFAGWDAEIAPVTADTVYRAVFTPVKRTYAVTFYYDDGRIYKTYEYNYGDIVVAPEAPQKTGDNVEYVFEGWKPDLTPVDGNMNFTAMFKSVPKTGTDNTGTDKTGSKSFTAGTIISLAVVVLCAGGFVTFVKIRSRRRDNPEV